MAGIALGLALMTGAATHSAALAPIEQPQAVAAGTAQSRAPDPIDQPTPPMTSNPVSDAPAKDPAVLPAKRAGEPDTIVVTAKPPPPPGDPLQDINAVSFDAVQAVDKAFIGPVTQGYEFVVPKQPRKGLHNFLNNLNEPIVFVNFLLQLNPAKAIETVARFGINSTLGVAGLFDMAKRKPFHLPRRSNGVADTLGFYGVPTGPYLFLPLIGSTTIRDMLGRSTDLLLLPATIGAPFNRPDYQLVSGVLSALDERSQFDEELKKIRKSENPYAAMRAYYLKRRACEIATLRALKKRHGQPPATTMVKLPGAPLEEIPCDPAPIQ